MIVQRIANLSRRIADAERASTDTRDAAEAGYYADIDYDSTAGEFVVRIIADSPLTYDGETPISAGDLDTDIVFRITPPGGGSVEYRVIQFVQDYTITPASGNTRLFSWWAYDYTTGSGTALLTAADATADADSKETYCLTNRVSGAAFSAVLYADGSYEWGAEPRARINTRESDGHDDIQWTYIRSLGAITRRLTSPLGYVDLPLSHDGPIYIGKVAYDDATSALGTASDSASWDMRAIIAHATVDSDGYLRAFRTYPAGNYDSYFTPPLPGDTNQITVVTSVDFGLQTVETATLTFSKGIYLDL